jgi:hypothetical protein
MEVGPRVQWLIRYPPAERSRPRIHQEDRGDLLGLQRAVGRKHL